MDRMRRAVMTCLAALLLAPGARSAEKPKPFEFSGLAANEWSLLPATGNGFWGNDVVYVPERGELLQWVNSTVLAFDATRGNWVADYPRTKKLPRVPMGHGYGHTGVTYCGTGVMLKQGVPAPSYTVFAACYDSKRKRMVIPMRGLMATYDPATKTWGRIDAKTILYGRTFPGGPPVFGIGTCYDPVNDEIVLFPHFVGTSGPGVTFMALPKNIDRMQIDGRVSSHLGTLRFRFADNTWRRVSDTFGSDSVRAARKALFERLRALSEALDGGYVIRRRPKLRSAKRIVAALESVASALTQAEGGLALVKGDLAPAAEHARAAAERAKKADWTATLAAGRDALWAIERVLDEPLRVEPPPRCAARMVYDTKNRVIVMFGGYSGLVVPGRGSRPGELNDTWLYDVKTKQWREIAKTHAPPDQVVSHLFHDPDESVTLLAVFEPGNRHRRIPDTVSLWTLDVTKGEWSQRYAVKWKWGLPTRNTYAAAVPRWSAGYDPRHNLLVVSLNGGKNVVMKLDYATLPGKPAPARTPLVAKPHVLPPDDPKRADELRGLPPNTWVAAKPKGARAHRGWSNVACDQLRGHVYTYGGGHSTYQVNDVAIYVVGANRWTRGSGDHNDFIPAAGWGGCTMGYRGGHWAHHMRNQYVPLDGRMFVAAQSTDRIAKMMGVAGNPHMNWFYDVDRGGIWRVQVVPPEGVTVPRSVKMVRDEVNLSLPSRGLVLATYGQKGLWSQSHVRSFDAYANTLRYAKVTGWIPRNAMEGTAMDAMRDQGQVFYLAASFSEKDAKAGGYQPCVYDLAKNTWTKLPSKNPPAPARPLVVCYLDGQDAVWACLARKWGRERTYWFYSLRTGEWTQLVGKQPGVAYPYGHVVYVQKYGVLFNVAADAVMRPDVSAAVGRK
jgi:hypothetical protein